MNYKYLFLALFIGSFLWYTGCKKDGGGVDPGSLNPGNTVTTTISGIVLDKNDSPVAGASVTASGQTIVTTSSGTFTFSKISVPKDRFVVTAVKSGFFDGSVSDVPVVNGSVSITVYLLQGDVTKSISAVSGGSIQTDNGTAVDLPSNSVVNSDGSAVSGNVKLTVAYLDPSSEDFARKVPGGDMRAVTSSNTETTLYSYGVIKVDMKNDAGSDVKLKSGTQSKITVDIPPSMESTAPSTIPLWHYDKTSGLWKEEGTATKQGDKYVGYVAHFSDWNCDVPGGTATVRGLVVDCNNAPVSGVTVKIGQANKVTGADGTFERRVPVNTSFEVQVLANRNFGISSTPIQVTSLTEGSVKDVGTIHIDCPAYVTAQLKCGTDTKYGQVVVSWTGGYSAQFTNSEGKVKIPVDLNKNAQVSFNTIDGKYKMLTTVTPSARGEVKDLGIVEICDQAVMGENKFTLNGDGFANNTYSFLADTNEVFGYYDPDSATTYVWMNRASAKDTVTLMLTFQGTTVGAAKNVMIYLIYNQKIYLSYVDIPGYDGALNITKYGGVGGIIEGTFSGKLYSYQTYFQTYTTLSAGKFSVIRMVFSKAVKNKLPDKLRSLLFKK